MPHGYADRSVRRYQAYTGTAFEKAHQQMKNKAPGCPIETAHGPQRLLEGLVFEYLKGDVTYFAHPIGITSVLPGPDSCTVTLDSSTTRHGHPLAAHAIEGLLPAEIPEQEWTEGGGHLGVSGIRVARVSPAALHLTLVGTCAHLTLRTEKATDWPSLIETRRNDLSAAGYTPCWDDPAPARQEQLFQAANTGYWEATRNASWLPSGLLRRAGLFHEVSAAYCTRYWATWDDWKMELNHDPGVQPPHDALVEHLTDARWGIGMRVDKSHCQCDATWADPHYDRECRVELSSLDGRPGTLQLRFRSIGTWRNSRSTHADLLRAQADPKWLYRVMPKHQEPTVTKSRGRRPWSGQAG
ncbi:hypothetical protein OG851_43325 (plasmid) [Streptomyces sp. NBC_00161]|uniref:hypothetical protein n=1 Tax=Streptomyces sp. NBC_00161 TaxID=2975671 RepID=UPI0032448F77